jgi:hypothetical protein
MDLLLLQAEMDVNIAAEPRSSAMPLQVQPRGLLIAASAGEVDAAPDGGLPGEAELRAPAAKVELARWLEGVKLV